MSDLATDFHDAPLNAEISGRLAGHGLTARRVDDTARAETDRWQDAVARGFLNGEPTDTQHDVFAQVGAYRRKLGVYDAAGAQPDLPVATFASWIGELTLPGAIVPACAISAVTVAPTHRRRGILRTLMSGELRTAAELGVPIAALTVSESTIYGRFGFASAAQAAHWEIDTRHVRWAGPARGRFDFVTREQGRAAAEALHERMRADSAGELRMPGGHWDRFFGTRATPRRRTSCASCSSAALRAGSTASRSTVLSRTRPPSTSRRWRSRSSRRDRRRLRSPVALLPLDGPHLDGQGVGARGRRAAVVDDREPPRGIHPASRPSLSARPRRARGASGAHVRRRRLDRAGGVRPLEIAGGTFVLTTDSTGVGEVDVVDAAPVGCLSWSSASPSCRRSCSVASRP
jgi:GNAT superfamily N-acetyltransferase